MVSTANLVFPHSQAMSDAEPVASTRGGAPLEVSGARLRSPRAALAGFFEGNAPAKGVLMNTLHTGQVHASAPSTSPWNAMSARRPKRTSRAAEIVAALYFALVLSTPWLVRDASFFVPPSHGVEIQMLNRAAAPAAVVHSPTATIPAR